MEEKITHFRGKYAFLSNFYPVSVVYDGMMFASSEAAFQAQKCANADERKQFTGLTATASKALGRKVEIRADWDAVKDDIMLAVNRQKFLQHKDLADQLIATGEVELIEGTPWNDCYWGVSDKTGKGQNRLGKILMRLRREFTPQIVQ